MSSRCAVSLIAAVLASCATQARAEMVVMWSNAPGIEKEMIFPDDWKPKLEPGQTVQVMIRGKGKAVQKNSLRKNRRRGNSTSSVLRDNSHGDNLAIRSRWDLFGRIRGRGELDQSNALFLKETAPDRTGSVTSCAILLSGCTCRSCRHGRECGIFSTTGKSLSSFRTRVKPRNKKYSAFQNTQISGIGPPPRPAKGTHHDRHDTLGRDAMDAAASGGFARRT